MIPYLKKGDKIAITCPAKKLPNPMDDAVRLLQSWGLEVVFWAKPPPPAITSLPAMMVCVPAIFSNLLMMTALKP
jgi:hypothetical protein